MVVKHFCNVIHVYGKVLIDMFDAQACFKKTTAIQLIVMSILGV